MTQDRFPMTIGGEEVLNEHLLLAYTENGEMICLLYTSPSPRD